MKINRSTFITAVLIFVSMSTTSAAETINQGTKLSFSGANSTQMYSNLDFNAAGGITGIRAANFGGTDQFVSPVTYHGTSGMNGISWQGSIAGLHHNSPNSGDTGLNAVLSTGIHGPFSPPQIDITANPGSIYRVQLVVFSDFNNRQFDIFVDGNLYADEFESFDVVYGVPTHSIYSFNVTADADGIDVDLGPGSVFDSNPFVQGIMVNMLSKYTCIGFDAPLAKGPVKVNKKRALPLKMMLLDEAGNIVTEFLNDTPPVLQVLYSAHVSDTPTDVTTDALGAGMGSEGNQFELNDDGSWQYNLKTNNYTASGTYTVSVVLNSAYVLDTNCVASFVVK